jgi:hypothetical protein
MSLLILFHIVEAKHGMEPPWIKRVHLAKRSQHTKNRMLRNRMRGTIQTAMNWGKYKIPPLKSKTVSKMLLFSIPSVEMISRRKLLKTLSCQ